MSFLSPFLLYGIALAAVPLIIHLLFSRKVKVMDWAAMQFLLDIMEQQKRVRIEDLLLLLLRMLLLALLAFAAAGPLLNALRPPGAERALIVVDGSFSMATRGGVQSRWDQAVAAVDDLLADLPAGSQVALVIAGQDPDPVLPQFSGDRDLVVETLTARGPGDGGGDPIATARVARELVASGGGEATTVYLVSDFQRNEWLAEPAAAALEQLAAEAPVELIPVGDEVSGNLVASDLYLVGGAARDGGVARFGASVRLLDAEVAREVGVELRIDGQTVATRQVTVAPDQATELYLAWDALGSGWREAELVVTGDRLAVDNHRYLPVRVDDGIPILVVADDAGAARQASDFLLLALDPQAAAAGSEGVYRPTVVDPGLAIGEDFADYELVIWAHVAAPDAALAAQLGDWVAAGGGALLFLGPDTAIEAYDRTMRADDLWPTPLRATPVGGPEGEARPLVVESPGHPLWKGLADGQVDHLASVALYGAYPFAGELGAEDSVLARVGTDEGALPVIADLRHGRGHLLVVGTSADPSLTSLCLQPAFVGFVQQAAGYLRDQSRGESAVVVGDPLRRRVDFERSQATYRVTAPDGALRTVSVLSEDDAYLLALPPLAQAGFYRLENSADPGDRLVVAANVQGGESRIASAAPDELEQALASERVIVRGRGATSVAASGWQLAGILLLVVLAVWVAENLLAHRIARRNAA